MKLEKLAPLLVIAVATFVAYAPSAVTWALLAACSLIVAGLWVWLQFQRRALEKKRLELIEEMRKLDREHAARLSVGGVSKGALGFPAWRVHADGRDMSLEEFLNREIK